jgi:protein-disulfide isomerase
MKRYLPFVIIAVVLLAGIGAATFMLRSARPQPQPQPTPLPESSPLPTPAIGVAKTVVTVEEYGDYQCPPCGGVFPALKTLKREFGNRIHFVFYHLPLTKIHKNALDAAHAAEAAKLQGRFWEMHDTLYQSQQVWSEADDIRPVVADFARQLGLDVERFKRDMDGPKVKAAVASDVQRAEALHIDSTPTIVIDGQTFPNEKLSVENLRAAIAQKLVGRP